MVNSIWKFLKGFLGKDLSLSAAMARAIDEGRLPPNQAGGPELCKRYVKGHNGPTPCEWPYCDCTKDRRLEKVGGQTILISGPSDPALPWDRVYRDHKGGIKACYGCAHSIGGAPYPSGPSGERPCLFCVRNPEQPEQLARARKNINPGVQFTARYDNKPTKSETGDQYIATDRLLRDIF